MMEILFKSNGLFFYIEVNVLLSESIAYYDTITDTDWNNIKEVPKKILYHYREIGTGDILSVYFEHNGRFISKRGGSYQHTIITLNQMYQKDYTVINLDLI